MSSALSLLSICASIQNPVPSEKVTHFLLERENVTLFLFVGSFNLVTILFLTLPKTDNTVIDFPTSIELRK